MNLKLDSNHDILIGRGATRVSGKEYTSQLVKCNLKLQLGEWLLNPNIGLPWRQEMLARNADNPLYQGILRTQILATPNVLQCNNVNIEVNKETRLATITFSGRSRDGNFSGEI